MATGAAIGALLRRLRVERDLTLDGLAALSGVSVRSIGDIERGVRTAPRQPTLVALADGLGLTGEQRDLLLGAVRADAGAEPAPMDAVRPHVLQDFTGRRSELDAIVRLLRDPDARGKRMVLSGPPGTGKTSIAMEALRRAAVQGASFYVDLGGASAAPLTAAQVVQALLRQVPGRPEAPAVPSDAAGAWERFAAGATGVIVLDDAAAEAQVRPALHGRGLRVLVTSRRTLAGLESVQRLTLGRLPREDSVAFLRSAIPEQQRTDEDVVALAELCGDLPLALRIAAGRVASQPARRAGDLVRRLRRSPRRLQLLTAGDLEVERAFAASYVQLSAAQAGLFRDLAVQPPRSFSAAAAAAAHALGEDEALDLLEELVDLGLVEPLDHGRFRLHDLLRLYAAERLQEEDPEAADHTRTIDRWYLGTAARAGDLFAPDDATAWTGVGVPLVPFPSRAAAGTWLRTEVDGWFSALRRLADDGRHHELLAVAEHINRFADFSLDLGRWVDFYSLTAASAEVIGDRRLAAEHLLWVAHMFNFETFEHERARETALRVVAAAREARDVRSEAEAILHVAIAERRLGRPDRAHEAYGRAAVLFDGLGDVEGALGVRHETATFLAESDPAAAEPELRALLRLVEDDATPLPAVKRGVMRWSLLGRLAAALTETGRAEEAVEVATAAIEATGSDPRGSARSHEHRGFARLRSGDAAGGVEDLREALRLAGPHRPQHWADRLEDAIRSAGTGAA